METKTIYFESLDSTNTKVRELALKGAEEGTVAVAEKQTAGKGRRGRTWESPAGTNIYMSVLLRPQIAMAKAPMLTLVMAYSIGKVLKEKGYEYVQIKWPNDLVLSGKKICGILTETELCGQDIAHIVVGIGINVNEKIFPEELVDKATSLYLESGKKEEREELIELILERFSKDYECFLKKENLEFMKDEYNQMLVNCKKEVRVLDPGNEYTAVAHGINEVGELLVEKADGSMEAVYAGEVSVRGIYGYV